MLEPRILLKLIVHDILLLYQNQLWKPAIAAMHGPHSVFDIGQCTVVHCDAGGVSWLTNE